MPNYDYVCDECGHQFEEFQSMLDKNLVDCPKCKKPKLRRLIGAGAGIIFKGSGFYSTDYRKGGTASDTNSKSTDSKPAEKSPAKESAKEASKESSTPDKSCGSCGKTGPDVCD
ncbi:MAG: zinc ribbon domain-containing protein [Planctomycetes bacterium]|nr:zinc ribbon domain-containing protein [Planctomycetota bacterium]